ncbi:MAG TPA: rhomboid family intramembrane serine protease, partial [Solirubrobacteraceae bacterium]|nr:rhomboid family intramembrane serine protease [Solirubrobacteraceae bacterium]
RTLPSTPIVTQAIIAINVVVFLAEVASGTSLGGGAAGSVYLHGALFGPALTAHNPVPFITGTHQYWRLLTAGFLHYSLIHIGLNMFFLFFVGPSVENAIGRVNYAAVYLASLLAGSFGALAFTPLAVTVGASGAIFGVFGCLIPIARSRGIDIWRSGIGLTLIINLAFTLSVKGISIGGHIGGLVAGVIAGFAIVQLGEKRRTKWAPLAICVLIAVVSVIGAIAVAGQHGIAPNGINY